MADNVNITEGVGKTISTDSVTRTVADEQMQIVKIGLGAENDFDNLVDSGIQSETVSVPVVRAEDAATFDTLVTLAFGSVGAGHSLLLTPSGNLRYIEIQNDTDAPVILSFDAGVTDHWRIPLKEPRIFDLNAFGRFQSAAIHIKHAGVAPTVGSVYAMGYR